MGGRIWVVSQPDQGSNFQFVISLPINSNHQEAPRDDSLRGHRCVLLSANRHAQEAYESILKGCGANVIVAAPSDDLLACLLGQSASESPADLLVADISVANPVELELIESIQNELQATVPILALVAPGGKIDVADRCRDLGIEWCLTKPVKTLELQNAVQSALGQHAAVAIAEDAYSEPLPLNQLRILVADDSPVNQEVAVGLLELRGHTAKTASSGREAIELWQREQFDLIFMDVEMHDLDGLAATAAIRKQEIGWPRRTPIVAMTAHANERFQDRCLAAGMDGFISKPFQPDELFRLIDRFCVAPIEAASTSP
jgi:CheY-like chemotaxis protein